MGSETQAVGLIILTHMGEGRGVEAVLQRSNHGSPRNGQEREYFPTAMGTISRGGNDRYALHTLIQDDLGIDFYNQVQHALQFGDCLYSLLKSTETVLWGVFFCPGVFERARITLRNVREAKPDTRFVTATARDIGDLELRSTHQDALHKALTGAVYIPPQYRKGCADAQSALHPHNHLVSAGS